MRKISLLGALCCKLDGWLRETGCLCLKKIQWNWQSLRDLVDRRWHLSQAHLEDFLLQSARVAPFAMRSSKRPHRQKGGPVVFQPYDSGTCNPIRVLLKLCGRLREWEFRKFHEQNRPPSDPLWKKISRSPYWKPGLTSKEVQTLIDHVTQTSESNRNQQWRSRLVHSDIATFKWLRGKPPSIAIASMMTKTLKTKRLPLTLRRL